MNESTDHTYAQSLSSSATTTHVFVLCNTFFEEPDHNREGRKKNIWFVEALDRIQSRFVVPVQLSSVANFFCFLSFFLLLLLTGGYDDALKFFWRGDEILVQLLGAYWVLGFFFLLCFSCLNI